MGKCWYFPVTFNMQVKYELCISDFFFHYEIKAGHKFISLTMKADFEKKYQGVIGKFGINFLTYYIWLSWVPDLHKQAEGNGQNTLTCDGGVMEGSPARKQYVSAMWSCSTMS